MAKYSIEETTLTSIGDALRRKHGETRVETITEFVPVKDEAFISSNMTDFGVFTGEMIAPAGTSYNKSITIENNFGKTKVKYYTSMPMEINDIETNKNLLSVSVYGEDEIIIDSNSFKITVFSGFVSNNNQGYYIEIYKLDADGNYLSGETVGVEKEVEVKNTYNPLDMADAIDDIAVGDVLPEEAFIITGNCNYRFSNDGWDWFLNEYGDRLTTTDITNASNMFSNAKNLVNIPFDINFQDGGCDCNYMFYSATNINEIPSIDFKQTSYKSCGNMFAYCYKVNKIGTLKNLYPSELGYIFMGCNNLRYLPNFENLNMERIYSYNYFNLSNMFSNCFSLREIPEEFLNILCAKNNMTNIYTVTYNGFQSCYVLDKITGLNPHSGTITSNMFYATFRECHRLKDIIFMTQEDGTPYNANWKTQTIDLSSNIGYLSSNISSYENRVLNYNAGITKDKRVYDDESYNRLKNDKDWYAFDESDANISLAYSRYNKQSAINTINSLPDTSSYLATAGGTNTIKFKGAAGSKTDSGAINTLTEEEIAIATVKGWTITFA